MLHLNRATRSSKPYNLEFEAVFLVTFRVFGPKPDGMIRSPSTTLLLCVLIVVTSMGCRRETEATPIAPNAPVVERTDSLLFLALGDSYTIGHDVLQHERWPEQLVRRLNTSPLGYSFKPPMIIAQTGWTTANLSAAMDMAYADTLRPDIVSLLIGVNNQYQGRDTGEYREEFATLLDRAVQLAGQSVIVIAIPDYGYTPFGISNQATITAQLNVFNTICHEETVLRGVAHVNITPISQEWPSTEGLIAPDGLHPSGEQYARWVEALAPVAAALLENE